MAHNKLRILYLARLLYQGSDQDHPLSVEDIQAQLQQLDITVERKTVYDDLELLRQFGMDIVYVRGKRHCYYLGQRQFELPELKLLIDVVQSSPFLTVKKSMELIGKLEGLASQAQATQLRRQVYVLDRVKTHNEQLYYNIDGINAAIQQNVRIRFRYFDWSPEGQRVLRHGGAWYQEDPVALAVDRNYYLVAYRPREGKYVHFRVDRMQELSVMAGVPRSPLPEGFDLAAYTRTIFDMHSGEPQRVTLELDQGLINVAMDRFGQEAHYRREGDRVVISAQVDVSPTFLTWVLGFGGRAKLLAPDSAVRALQDLARGALARYGE